MKYTIGTSPETIPTQNEHRFSVEVITDALVTVTVDGEPWDVATKQHKIEWAGTRTIAEITVQCDTDNTEIEVE